MRYSETNQVLDPLLRVLRHTFDFKGRAQRIDGVLYYITASFVSAVAGLGVIASPLGFNDIELVSGVIGLLIQLPLVAWFVRRAHDYDLSGSWLLPFLLWMFARPVAQVAGFEPADLDGNLAVQLVGIAVVVAFLCAAFWKPSEGANRFGPNPRFDELDEEFVEGAD